MKKPEPEFKVGDWVRFTDGPDKGRTTTLTCVQRTASGFYYEGYFCGRNVGGTDTQTARY